MRFIICLLLILLNWCLSAEAWRFRLIALAYNRRASLVRLINSLNRADYHGHSPTLEIILEGQAHPYVRLTALDALRKWSKVYTAVPLREHNSRLGLEKMMMTAWTPDRDDEIAVFFEDDIEVAKDYFGWILRGLEAVGVISSPPNNTNPSKKAGGHDQIMGISLNSPPLNEISEGPKEWFHPSDHLPRGHQAYLFNLPNSWGAAYLPGPWLAFKEYYTWRKQIDPMLDPKVDVVPGAESNRWIRSWKRYLIEYFVLKGMVMLHPSLPQNACFSTHHREPGQHTSLKGAQDELLDSMTIKAGPFTVPLTELNAEQVNIPFSMEEMAVLSLYHRRVASLNSLKWMALTTENLLRPYGLSYEHPTCILPNHNDEAVGSVIQEKWLTFRVPDKDDFDPVITLQHLLNACILSDALGRKFLIPNRLEHIFQREKVVDVVSYSIAFAPSDYAIDKALAPDSILPAGADIRDIRDWLGSCNHSILEFSFTHQSFFKIQKKQSIRWPTLQPHWRTFLEEWTDKFGLKGCMSVGCDPNLCQQSLPDPLVECKASRDDHWRACFSTLTVESNIHLVTYQENYSNVKSAPSTSQSLAEALGFNEPTLLTRCIEMAMCAKMPSNNVEGNSYSPYNDLISL